MVHPIRNHIARTATTVAKRVKTTTHSKAEMDEKQAARQRSRTKASTYLQPTKDENFSAPVDPAERHVAEASTSRTKRRNLDVEKDAEGWTSEDEWEVDTLLQEGGKEIADDDI